MGCIARVALETENKRLLGENAELLAYMARLMERVVSQCPEVLCVNSELLGTVQGSSSSSSSPQRSEGARHTNGAHAAPPADASSRSGSISGGWASKWLPSNQQATEKAGLLKKKGITEVGEEMV